MNKLKRIIAGAAAICMCSFTAACSIGDGTDYVLTVNGTKIPAGVYIYYAYSAYQEALQEISSQNSSIDTSDSKAVKKAKIDGKSTKQWVQDKATELCEQYEAIEEEFDKLKLSLTDEEKSQVKLYSDQYMENYGDALKKFGVSEDSLKKVLTSNYKTNEVFDHYYAIGGSEGVTEDELYTYYIENNARLRMITFSKTDSDGNTLKGKAKKALKKKIQEWQEKVAAEKSAEDKEDKMDEVATEYSEYVEIQSEEAAAKTTATDENGSVVTATTRSTTTTVEATEEDETEDESETTKVKDRGKKTTTDEDSTDDAVVTNEEGETETTTTTSPYENETIVSKYTTTTDEDGNKPKSDEISYSPSKSVQMALFDKDDDDYIKTGELKLIDDDESNSYYLILRLNIEDRMTKDDLWTDDDKESCALTKYNDEFQKKLDAWVDDLDVVKNDSAYKKYDVLNIDLTGKSSN